MNDIMKRALEAAKTTEKEAENAAKNATTASLKNIFSDAITSVKARRDGRKAEERLEEGKKITFKPKSLRYTYEDRANTNFNSKWKPSDGKANPEDELSPEGYFRPQTAKKINGKAKYLNEKRNGVNPDRLDDFNQTNRRFFSRMDKGNQTTNERRNISVDSTAIKKFTYDPKTQGLTVQFQGNSKQYFYPGVPEELIRQWIEASSKGEFFLSNIHDQYSMNPSHKHSTNVKNTKFYKWFRKNYKGPRKTK